VDVCDAFGDVLFDFLADAGCSRRALLLSHGQFLDYFLSD
jgi:hypothetical protein